ncbi:MAG: branched-chain amino acid ABC transporter permease [Chloroflexia bacterium]
MSKRARLLRSLGLVGGVLILSLLPLALQHVHRGEYYLHVLTLVLLYAYLSTAWNILGGYAGQHSLGHGIFLGIGAYTSTLLFSRFGVTPWLGMWAGALLAGAVGAFIGFLCFRYGLRGPYFALATIAIAEAMRYVVSNIPYLGGARGLEVPWKGHNPALFQFAGKTWYYYVALVLTLLCLAISAWLNRSRLGYWMVAVRENEDAAAALGVDLVRTKVVATVVSAVLTGIGGTFYAQYFTFVNPASVFGEGPSVQILLYSIIGGLGTVWGSAIGSLVLVPIAEFTRARLGGTFAGVHLLIYGAILMVVMLFMPQGIVGLVRRIRRPKAEEDRR